MNIKSTFNNPKELVIKWQLDVKYVPKDCYVGNNPDKFCQYTLIDEVSRERFIFPYREQSSYSTIDFLKRAIVFFGYKRWTLQTDNYMEFTYTIKTNKVHPLDTLYNKLNIHHQLIMSRNPRHNGKVESSHHNDGESFYKFLSFYSYDDLTLQKKAYLKRYNNIPMQTLGWLSQFR